MTAIQKVNLPDDGSPLVLNHLPNREYHSSIGLSSTELKLLDITPSHLFENRAQKLSDNKDGKPETDAIIEGQAFHTFTLEPEKFDRKFQVLEEGEIKSAKKKKDAEAQGIKLLSYKQGEAVRGMGFAIRKHENASKLIKGVIEQSLFWRNQEHGFISKCRPDIRNEVMRMVIDIKSSGIVLTDDLISKTIASYKYHWPAHHYLTGVNTIFPSGDGPYKWAWVFVEKDSPHGVRIVEPDDSMMLTAQLEVDFLYDKYAEALTKLHTGGQVESYDPAPAYISLPGWYLPKRREKI